MHKLDALESDEEIDFAAIPLTTKNQMQQYWNEDTLSSLLRQKGHLSETSGTTGIPMKVFWSEEEYLHSNFYTWRLRQKWYGITPAMKYCTFHSCIATDKSTETFDALVINQGRTLSLGRYVYTKEIVAKYIALIDDFEAKWILAPPSILCLLAGQMIKENICLSKIKYIEFNGEFVDSVAIEVVKKAFPRAKIANLYGSTEFNGIALSCPFGKLHILKDNVYVESIEENNEPLLYITGLINTRMPFIRYRIGDIGRVTTDICRCGCVGPFLDLKRGRASELIRMKNNLLFDPSAFNNIIHSINKKHHRIAQFQIQVNSLSEIEIVLLLTSTKWECAKIEEEVLSICKNLNARINYKVRFVHDELCMYNSNNKFVFIKYNNE